MATTKMNLPIEAAGPGTSAIPAMVNTAGTNSPVPGYSFTIASVQAIYWHFPIFYYGSGNLTLNLVWYASGGQTTGNVRWDSQIMAITPGDAQSLETDAFATATNTTTTVNGTARGPTKTQVTISNLDSLAEEDCVRLKLICNSGTLASNPILTEAWLTFSDS